VILFATPVSFLQDTIKMDQRMMGLQEAVRFAIFVHPIL
jgi:hypothetical protein